MDEHSPLPTANPLGKIQQQKNGAKRKIESPFFVQQIFNFGWHPIQGRKFLSGHQKARAKDLSIQAGFFSAMISAPQAP